MTVKIITDSNSDISPEVAKTLDIVVVPAYVSSGGEGRRGKVDLSNEKLNHQAVSESEHPEDELTKPEDFARIYANHAKKAEGILSIHASSKTSGIYDVALQGKKLAKGKCQIEVIDSTFSSVGLALVAMAAARSAKEGENLLGVFEETQEAIDQVSVLAMLDSMESLTTSGQTSGAKAIIAKLFKMKPLLNYRKGELVPAGLVRKYNDGLDRLHEFAFSYYIIRDIAIAHSNIPERAEELKARLSSIFPEENIYIAQLGSGLGIPAGSGALVLALRRGH